MLNSDVARDSSQLRSRFVVAGGVKTHYVEAGEGERVVVAVHGGVPGSSGAGNMGALMVALSGTFRAIALDSVGGFGQTDPSAPVNYGLQSRLDHLTSFIDALGLEKISLIGNSQGGWCIAKYAIMHPDRVENLILLGSGSVAKAMGLNQLPSEGLKLMEAYDGTHVRMQQLLEGLICDRTKITPRLVGLHQAAAQRPGAPAAFKALGEANRRLQNERKYWPMFEMQTALPAITQFIPTTMIWGTNDIFAVPSLGRLLEPLLPAVKFHWLDDAGHEVQIDRPEYIADIVCSFAGPA
jgi:pimeloyl-ACP methyl ester carboxylesterase